MKNESPFQATEQQLRYIPVGRYPGCCRPADMMGPKVLSAGSFTNPRWLPLVCKNRINELWAMVIHRSKIIYIQGLINETAQSLVKKSDGLGPVFLLNGISECMRQALMGKGTCRSAMAEVLVTKQTTSNFLWGCRGNTVCQQLLG